jgi:hypothetical protein
VSVTTTSTPTTTTSTPTTTTITPTTTTTTTTPIRKEPIEPVMFIDEGGTRPILTTTPTPIKTSTPVFIKEEVPYRLQETPLMIEQKPILTSAVRETIAPQIAQAELSRKLAFDGSKTIAFEVGGCLNDL